MLTTQFLHLGEKDRMTLFSNNHILPFLCFMQEYQGIGQNLLEVWSFKSSSTRSKGKWKNRCNSEASCCQKKHETTDMFCLFLFSPCVLYYARLSSWQPWGLPASLLPSCGKFVCSYETLCCVFVFPYCPILCHHLQTVITSIKRFEYFNFNSVVFPLQNSCLYNFIYILFIVI